MVDEFQATPPRSQLIDGLDILLSGIDIALIYLPDYIDDTHADSPYNGDPYHGLFENVRNGSVGTTRTRGGKH
jgi:hypothetical protein